MKEKNHGIDALRILSMFMITILHILNQGGLLNATDRFTSQYELGWLLEIFVFCAVDIYALISGYVWVNAEYKLRKILELWLQVVFYTVSITILFSVFNPQSVSLMEWIKAFFPVMFKQYWYISSYVGLFLFIPLLNIILDKLEKRQLQLCLFMIFFFFSGMQTLFYSNAFCSNDGYSTIWLLILYLVGGYIRKYRPFEKNNARIFLIGYFVMVGLTWLSKLLIENLTLYLLGEVRAGNYLINYQSPTILLSAAFLVLCFQKIRFTSFGVKIISFISPMALSVYLIHVHPLVFAYIIKDRFAAYSTLPWYFEVTAIIGTALCINIACYIIDIFRLKLFKLLHIREKCDALVKKLGQLVSHLTSRPSK